MNTQQKHASILIVEDNPLVLGIHADMIRDIHSEPDMAATGHGALLQVRQNPPYRIIFMDIGLPDIDGIEVAAQIRALELTGHRKAVIIGLTGLDIADVEAECLAAGMNLVLTKPISQEKMKQLIDAYMPKKVKLSIVRTDDDLATVTEG